MERDDRLELIAATFSPMHSDGSINTTPVEAYARHLVQKGISAVFINGTTGESLSLTLDERRELAEAWLRGASEQLPVMVHVGHNAMADAAALARHAEEIGAAAISAMAPTFFKPNCVDDLVSFLIPIAAAAPETPFFFYHIPSMNGVELVMEELLERAASRIPTFAGIKYTHNDLTEYLQCLDRWGDRYRLLFGRDELLLPALSVGVRGAIGTTFNLFPATYAGIAQAYFKHDMRTARELSIHVNRGLLLFKKFGLLQYGKKYMATVGVDCGEARPPFPPVSDEQFEELMTGLREIPLLDHGTLPYHGNRG